MIEDKLRSKIREIIKITSVDTNENDFIDCIIYALIKDLEAICAKDQASKSDPFYVLSAYLSYYSVICYRVANVIVNKYNKYNEARRISEYCKIKTGIEIHPKAIIGERFSIDHGYGTVIGEDVEIGDNCYILQNVILGSRHIVRKSIQKTRHPKIGNNVEIGAFSMVIGSITIGNDVIISPYSIVTKNIPDRSKLITYTKYKVLSRY